MTETECFTFEAYPSRELRLGDLEIARALPLRQRRTVGPWCFLDRFGPLSFDKGRPMDVAPHPHIGLQTVTWLLAGEVRHDDSLGYEAVVAPGGVNVMTAGQGIAHAERTPVDNSGRLSGVQLWAALPDAHRGIAPAFEHFAEVPVVERPGGVVRVFSGTLVDVVSPVKHYSALVGAEVTVHPGETLGCDLEPEYEHALLLLDGNCAFEGRSLQAKQLYDQGAGRSSASFTSESGGRVLLVGGPPFPEEILMWWNFVARTPEEIAEARADWQAHRRFGEVRASDGPRLVAPSLGKLAPPNPVS
ncbi:MAG: pirin family protein [Anaerolineae bacterium]